MSHANNNDFSQREVTLIAAVEYKLPDFARTCQDAPDVPAIILHQDAFAADYHEEEYRLLGMAIKFAGIYGKDVHITGATRRTANQCKTSQDHE
jgi:hypothetical protein